jgi:hypothetical protein
MGLIRLDNVLIRGRISDPQLSGVLNLRWPRGAFDSLARIVYRSELSGFWRLGEIAEILHTVSFAWTHPSREPPTLSYSIVYESFQQVAVRIN